MEHNISTDELRRLLPDVALHIDKAFMLTRWQPLGLDIMTDDDTNAIRIRLTNGFTLVLIPAGVMNGDYPSWTGTERVVTLKGADPLEILARAANNEYMQCHTEVPVFRAWARLEVDDTADTHLIPSEHKFVQSADPILLIDDALAWMQQHTHLPLRWSHRRSTP